MSLLEKFFTEKQTGSPQNCVEAFTLEVQKTDKELSQSKRHLTELISNHHHAKRAEEIALDKVGRRLNSAKQALAEENEALALEKAEEAAKLELQAEENRKQAERLSAQIELLQGHIKQASRHLTDMQRQLLMAKTNASVQNAKEAIKGNNQAHPSSLTAKQALDSIKQRAAERKEKLEQIEKSARNEAAIEQVEAPDTSKAALDILQRLKETKNS